MKLIDLGAFNGDSALHFIANPEIDRIDAYDPNTSFTDIWAAISKHYTGITYYPLAVYTYNGTIDYLQRPDDLPLGSTIMREKGSWSDDEIKPVECIDILDVLTERCQLKMDIEGAEYDVLERIIDNGKSDLIDRLYVEWHGSKMTGDYQQRQERITKHFGKKLKAWW